MLFARRDGNTYVDAAVLVQAFCVGTSLVVDAGGAIEALGKAAWTSTLSENSVGREREQGSQTKPSNPPTRLLSWSCPVIDPT